MSLLGLAAAVAGAGWLFAGLAGLFLRRRLDRLADEPPLAAPPTVSIVAPCRDEAAGVERAVRSWLAVPLPGLEVVAVDDRSADGTGAILDRLAREDPRVTALHVRALPPGWLGKNHACHLGASRARGEWLLFTDGDVVLAPDALPRALAFAARRGLGHLVAFPALIAPGLLERAFVSAFALLFGATTRPWALRSPGTRAFVGVGAFNLVRADDYRRLGGHGRLRIEVADDVKLGMWLRRGGVRQGAVDSGGRVSVRWQSGFRASWRGLVKNAFAGLEYRWSAALALAAGLLLLGLAPPLAALLGAAPARAAGLGACALAAGLHAAVARRFSGGSGVEGLLFPVALAALAAVILASAASATLRGGIVWRGTRYPLAALRAGCLRERALDPAGAPGWDGRGLGAPPTPPAGRSGPRTAPRG